MATSYPPVLTTSYSIQNSARQGQKRVSRQDANGQAFPWFPVYTASGGWCTESDAKTRFGGYRCTWVEGVEPHWYVTELSIPAIRIPWAYLDFSIARLGAVSIDSGCKMWRMPEKAR